MLVRIACMRRDITRLPGPAVEAPAPPCGRLVRFPCGHTDPEAHLARTLRGGKNAVWVCCPQCNVIALAVAIIERWGRPTARGSARRPRLGWGVIVGVMVGVKKSVEEQR